MQKIVFEDTTVVKSPYVLIDGVEHEVYNGTYQGGTDLNANTFNTMQDNIENAIKDTYSTDEIKIGTWINNKPIYRKVIDCGALPNANVKNVEHDISNLDTVTLIRGVAYNPTSETRLPLPYSDIGSASWSVQMFCNQTQIVLITGDNKSVYQQSCVIIEYTKTTD